MIHVERPSTPPSVLLEEGPSAVERAREFFEGRTIAKSQVKFADYEFELRLWDAVRQPILELFRGKCAFCESPVTASDWGDVQQFRPKRDALSLDGTTSAMHYYWLAYEWQNLYSICGECNRNKRNLFPVAGGRAAPGTPWSELEDRETRLLLDPCLDLPEEHLVFDDAGHVASVTLEMEPSKARSGPGNPPFDDRGTITIDTFGLNRYGLIRAREQVASETAVALELALRESEGDAARLEQAIAGIVDPSRPHAMVRRQVAARWSQQREELDTFGVSQIAPTEAAQQVQVSAPHRKRAFARLEKHEAEQAAVPIQSSGSYARTTHVARVYIENFRGVEELEFELPPTGWKVLIGENGTGKSSILQAIAIALMGRQKAHRLQQLGELQPKKLVRRGKTRARIVVHQAASLDPIDVRITRDGIEFPRGRARQKAVLLGFGSARWLPRPRTLPPERDEWIRVRNLLNPFVPLGDADRWLRSLRPGTNRFRAAEAVVKSLLRFSDGTRLRVLDDEVRVQEEGQTPGRALTLDQLSDGYQSALAMAAGIMGPLFSKFEVIRDADGVVLVDELEAHLHPRWKMRISGDLRRAFPNVQFIASTHDPLCLRGLLDHEILLLEKDEDWKVRATVDLPSAAGLRVDQLLTSRFFGLHSTLDPTTERDLEEYYTLLALDTRTPEQETRLEELRKKVGSEGMLGDTPRDQLIYAVIDKFIAKDLREGDPKTRPTRQAETEERVAQIWQDAIAADRNFERVLADVLGGEP